MGKGHPGLALALRGGRERSLAGLFRGENGAIAVRPRNFPQRWRDYRSIMKNPSPSEAPASHDEIARRAYALWEEQGRPEGEHERHWQQAEQQLRDLPPARQGNAAYPSLAAREKIVDDHKKYSRKEIPAVAKTR